MTEDHAAELARVQALLDHAQQRSIASLAAAKDGYLRGRKDGYGHGFEQGIIQGRRQATEANPVVEHGLPVVGSDGAV